MNGITVILNGWKRPHFLKEQLEAINNQTVKAKEIMMWQNCADGFTPELTQGLTIATSNKNLGVWARFAYALNAKTEYICVLDDDTIPGTKWFENCLNTMKTHEGLLGTVGIRYNSTAGYYPNTRYGWAGPNNETIQVDIVGHAWFFKREWLTAYWRELPPIEFDIVGEDMHFSYTIQKYLELNTYVPPHPPSDMEMWGSLKGWELGTEKNALSLVPVNINKMNDYLKILFSKGFKIINQ